MIANTLTVGSETERIDLAERLVDTLLDDVQDVEGYPTVASLSAQDDNADWFAAALVRDTARGKWIVVTRDASDNAVTEHDDLDAAVEDAATFLETWEADMADEARAEWTDLARDEVDEEDGPEQPEVTAAHRAAADEVVDAFVRTLERDTYDPLRTLVARGIADAELRGRLAGWDDGHHAGMHDAPILADLATGPLFVAMIEETETAPTVVWRSDPVPGLLLAKEEAAAEIRRRYTAELAPGGAPGIAESIVAAADALAGQLLQTRGPVDVHDEFLAVHVAVAQVEDGDDDEDDKEPELIRGKWLMDGADSLEDAARRLEAEAARLRALAADGWQLAPGTTVEDDHGQLTR